MIYTQSNKSLAIIEQCLAHLVTVKRRSLNPILDSRLDLLYFFVIWRPKGYTLRFQLCILRFHLFHSPGWYVCLFAYCHGPCVQRQAPDTERLFLAAILEVSQNESVLNWQHIAEKLETTKLPKRDVWTLTLGETVRLLTQAKWFAICSTLKVIVMHWLPLWIETDLQARSIQNFVKRHVV